MLSTISPGAMNADTAEQLVARLDSGGLNLPSELRDTLRQIIHELRAGNEVTVMSSSSVLTTAEAAEILNVSRPHVVKLVDDGTIAHHMVGSHRRLALTDVLDYKAKRVEAGHAALAEIQQLADDTSMDL